MTAFVRDKEVLAVKEHFFSVNDQPHLACLITYQDPLPSSRGSAPDRNAPGDRRARRPKDALAALEPDERVLFGTLREWRNEVSRKEGVLAFVILTNRELIAILKARPATPNALLAIDGIGPAKVERYGKAILEIVRVAKPSPTPEGSAR